MPTDLQIIDGFESLRDAFLRDNPGFAPPPPDDPPPPDQRVVEAWLLTRRPRWAEGSAGQRRLRSMTRLLLCANGDRPTTLPEIDAGDRPLADAAPRIAEAIQAARRKNLPPLAETRSSTSASPVEEARAWSALLPNLSGLNAWRFLHRLGRPLVVPESAIRRAVWRIGLAEEAADRTLTPAQTHGALDRVGALTGLTPPHLAPLMRWLTSAGSGWKGGGWCVAEPRCPVCPLRSACAWARFHPDGRESPPRPASATDADAARLMAEGRHDQLQELELLALMLPARVGGQTNRELAGDLLRQFGGLRGLERASVAELTAVRGVARRRALAIKAALTLGRRLAENAFQPGDSIRSSEDIWRAYRGRFQNLPQEHFVILLLDNKNRVIQDHVVSKGTLTGSHAHPREVFHRAVRQSAAAIILLHNHPSGDPSPSPEDREVTERLREAGEILGIKVLDHIILGAEDYYSFTDET